MRLFLALVLLAATASAGDREYRKLKKWAMHKACESCLGKEASKAMMIKYKTAAAKCMKVDAPELDLPMFNSPYRSVGALVDGAFAAAEHNSDGHGRYPHLHRPGGGRPHHGPGGGMRGDDYLGHMIKKIFFKKFVEKMIEEEFLEEEDEDNDPLGPIVGGQDQGVLMKLFKRGGHSKYSRGSRQLDKKEVYELGDRLTAKLQGAKEKVESEVGNYTCMLRECGMIDDSNRLVSPDQIIRKWRQIPINGDDGDGWLRRKLEEGIRTCHEFAEAVPQEILNKCHYGPELAKVKMFKKCFKMCKLRTCVNYDVKQQLEQNFGGSLQDLTETTQLDEDELLPLVQKLLHGPEMDM